MQLPELLWGRVVAPSISLPDSRKEMLQMILLELVAPQVVQIEVAAVHQAKEALDCGYAGNEPQWSRSAP